MSTEIHVEVTPDTRIRVGEGGATYALFVEAPVGTLNPVIDISDWDNESCDAVRFCTDLTGDELIEIAVQLIQFVGVQRDRHELAAHVTMRIKQGYGS